MSETILVFGGNQQRLDTAIELAKQKPNSYLIYSSGENRSVSTKRLGDNGIYSGRYLLEYDALDTLTNVTVNFNRIKARGTKTLYLVSDHWHIPRCRAIADIVFKFSGIKIVNYPLVTNSSRFEPRALVNHDKMRALLWKLTGLVFFPQHVKDRQKRINAADKL